MILDFEDSDDYVRFAAVNDLYFMRRYAAKLAYETTLHAQTGSLEDMPAEYSRRLSTATKVTVPEENYLADVDDGFYCASYLRAWMLEGALRLMLQENFGMDWYASRDAGDWLRGLWGRGPAPHRRAAAAAARRRPAQHRPAAAPVRAGAGALTCAPAAQAGRNVTSTRRRRGPSNSAK